jgi:methylornithine synthase
MTGGLLIKAEQGESFSREEIKQLLSLSESRDLSRLFAAARAARQTWFGDAVFLYGFLYFSTYCRNNCRFCQYRKPNTKLGRYRKTLPQIIKAAKEMARTGVHLIDLTMGEDPEFHRTGFQPLVSLVRAAKRETGLPVMVSPGVIPDGVIRKLAAAGAEWLACYQETHNRKLYAGLRPGQDYDLRMASKRAAAGQGMLVEEGLLTGVGENLDDLADSIITMRDLDFDQVRVMTFVPQAGAPLAGTPVTSRLLEQKVIAVMRLVMPDRLIPASLDVDGLDGVKDRLNAGANVVTSIVPPAEGLAGVANSKLDIEESRRSVGYVSEILVSCGLSVASQRTYRDWITQRRQTKTIAAAAGAA